MVVNKKTGAGGSPGGYQGVKPGAGKLPLLIDRDQLLAPWPVTSHPFPLQQSATQISDWPERGRPKRWLLSQANRKEPASASGGD